MKTNVAKITTFALALFVLLFAPSAFAEESSSQLSSKKRDQISENCGSIRQSLKLLQRSDARTRTYYGAIYETALSKYITPLNLRLVKNDLSSVALINLQTALATSRSNFSADYIDYSKSLEELIAIDCRLEPETFYNKLVSTREKREVLQDDVKTISTLLTNSVKSVEIIKENLDD
ncbi:hypothetical protein IJ095_00670 [Candidatus Saccharibacteria bacterium]|nr:hypothetical protein [Candidatus Saccharibacteria bacterium]